MDLLGPRAIPALVAALQISAGAAAEGASCASLSGVYANLSVETRGGASRRLSDFASADQRRRLHRFEGGGPIRLEGQTRMRRPKVTPLAARVTIAAGPGEAASLRFFDENGRLLAETRMDSPWRCEGDRLQRAEENLSGLGEDIRTERLEQRLHRDAEGDLVLTETLTVVDPPGAKPRRTEWRFKRVILSS